MRIKRFTAPDMRTALRMVRDEQGADAVILSNRAVDGGIEVVAATDYDEALVQQALRAAAPGFAPIQPPVIAPVAAPSPAPVAPVQAPTPIAAAPAPAPTSDAVAPAVANHAPVAVATKASAPRETLVSRARAVFRIGDAPAAESARASEATLAELIATPAPVAAAAPIATSEPAPTRFEAMMAALAPMPAAESTAESVTDSTVESERADASASAAAIAARAVVADRALSHALIEATETTDAEPIEPVTLALLPIESKPIPEAAPVMQVDTDACTDIDTGAETARDIEATPIAAELAAEPATNPPPPLRIVATAEPDPAIAAMRDEMSSMRQLIERQMGQFALERLRGSKARAAAYEALIGYGCEDVLAQAVASRIDAQLDPARIHAPMLAELARTITIARSEPLDEGGVIALVGPTGAGKTTTVAKLAARYAARHRARDVALVTTDGERTGAREQLHAHGRRLGITVCEAAGPEALNATLEQLGDYPLVLVDTAGFAARDRAVFGQILWLRSARKVRSLLVLPANAHPHDLGEVIRRYRPAAPEGVVLTKLDETGRLGSALSVMVRHGLSLAYTTDGQQVPADLAAADAGRLVETLEKLRRAADNPLATEDRHALA